MADIDLNRLPPVLSACEAEVRDAREKPRQHRPAAARRRAASAENLEETLPDGADDEEGECHQLDRFA